jgi:hypothetical protein
MISRRGLVFGAGAAVSVSRSASAKLLCQDFPGARVCTTGVNIRVNTAQQRCPEWCWAACVEAIFAFHNHRISQERIVEKVFSGPVCAPAIGPQIVSAIDGEWTDDHGDTFDASAEVLWDTQFAFGRPDAVVVAARELESGNPLILGAMGHATMMTAMTYSGNGFAVQINEVVVRDPWPGNLNRRTLSLQEALMTQFLAKVELN